MLEYLELFFNRSVFLNAFVRAHFKACFVCFLLQRMALIRKSMKK